MVIYKLWPPPHGGASAIKSFRRREHSLCFVFACCTTKDKFRCTSFLFSNVVLAWYVAVCCEAAVKPNRVLNWMTGNSFHYNGHEPASSSGDIHLCSHCDFPIWGLVPGERRLPGAEKSALSTLCSCLVLNFSARQNLFPGPSNEWCPGRGARAPTSPNEDIS